MQYTIRGIPEGLDKRLRERAGAERRSLNEVVIRLLTEALGLTPETTRRRDLGDVAGTWENDPAFDAALLDQDSIDPELWK